MTSNQLLIVGIVVLFVAVVVLSVLMGLKKNCDACSTCKTHLESYGTLPSLLPSPYPPPSSFPRDVIQLASTLNNTLLGWTSCNGLDVLTIKGWIDYLFEKDDVLPGGTKIRIVYSSDIENLKVISAPFNCLGSNGVWPSKMWISFSQSNAAQKALLLKFQAEGYSLVDMLFNTGLQDQIKKLKTNP